MNAQQTHAALAAAEAEHGAQVLLVTRLRQLLAAEEWELDSRRIRLGQLRDTLEKEGSQP